MITPDERIYFFVERLANTDLNSVSVTVMAEEYRKVIAEAGQLVEDYNSCTECQVDGRTFEQHSRLIRDYEADLRGGRVW